MYSEIVEGKVLDYHFKPLGQNAYNFSVGDLHVGQVFKIGKTWTAVTNRANPLFPIAGFATRMDAAEILLKVFRQSRLSTKEPLSDKSLDY